MPCSNGFKTTNIYRCKKWINTKIQIKYRLNQYDLINILLEFTKFQLGKGNKLATHGGLQYKRGSWRLKRWRRWKEGAGCITITMCGIRKKKDDFAWQPRFS